MEEWSCFKTFVYNCTLNCFEMNNLFAPETRYGSEEKVAFVEEVRGRMKQLAIDIINLMNRSPSSPALNTIRFQVLKSATSMGANYRAACRARSKKEFFAKLSITVEESDETVYWLELLLESDVRVDKSEITRLLPIARRLTALVAKARSTAGIH